MVVRRVRCRACRVFIMALRMVRSFRAVARIAAFFGLPAASRRVLKAARAESTREALMAAG